MKVTAVIVLSLFIGMIIGYGLSLNSAAKKSLDHIPEVAEALSSQDTFSDIDMVHILRMYRGSVNGKNVHEDKAVLRYIAKYYQHRSSLPEPQQEALGASVNLRVITELRKSDATLDSKIAAEQDGALDG